MLRTLGCRYYCIHYMLMKPYVSLRPEDQLKNVSLFCLNVEYILLYLPHPSHE